METNQGRDTRVSVQIDPEGFSSSPLTSSKRPVATSWPGAKEKKSINFKRLAYRLENKQI